jgi:hypothetical protein
MFKLFVRRAIVFVLIMSLSGINLPQVVHAELIGTQTLIELQERENRIARVTRILAQDEVRNQLVKMGVDPADAQARVAVLSKNELELLAHHLDNLPAGGSVLEVVGIVFLVLLILELVGVTNIFSKI